MIVLSDSTDTHDVQVLDAAGFFWDAAEHDPEAAALVARFEQEFPEFLDLLWVGDAVSPEASGVAQDYMQQVREWFETWAFVRSIEGRLALIEDTDLVPV